MEKETLEKIVRFCPTCEKKTEFEYYQTFHHVFALDDFYKCNECEGTYPIRCLEK